eukprot:95951_1
MCLLQSQDPTKTGAKRIISKLMKSKFINEYYECNPMDRNVTKRSNTYKYNKDVICNDEKIKNENVINVHGNSYKYNKNGKEFKNVNESLTFNRKYGKYWNNNMINVNNKTGEIPVGKYVNVKIKMINEKNMKNMSHMNNKINTINIIKMVNMIKMINHLRVEV